MRHTLASRIAALLVLVTLAALSILVVTVSFAVDAVLRRKTDQLLDDVTSRAAAMLDAAVSDELGWADAELEELRPPDVRLEVRSPEGELYIGLGPTLPIASAGDGCGDVGTVRTCGRRAARVVLFTSRDRADDLAARHRLVVVLLAAAAVVAILVALGSRSVARRAVGPLTTLATRVDGIEPGTGECLDLRSGLIEVDGLARQFDALVERFEEALARERRFAAEASHELRTPLTVARAEVESLTRGEADPGAATRALIALDGLGALIDRLLWFARAQTRLDVKVMGVINVADLVREELAIVARMQPERPLWAEMPDEGLVHGDETLLRRMVANLVDNAVRHGTGAIAVRLELAEDVLELHVINDGAAMPADRVTLLFEPFVRGGSRADGFGLGLPFARAVARAHGGDVDLAAGRVDGTEAIVRLPRLATS